jgi:Arc/MetJ-type ribon-helix-helix transcriptional regulator
LKFAGEYQKSHHLESRSDVILEAIRALGEKHLLERYRPEALEFERNPDPWVDSGLEEALELLK